MNLFRLSWKYLTFKPLSTGLNVILLALGLAIITVLILVQDQFENKMTKDAEGIDLVVGAKGSPLQLILSGVYHIDFPTGNIPLEEAKKLSRSRLIRNIIPLALGDNYKGYRIVGTNHDYVGLFETQFDQGKVWEQPYEVVVGATVALREGLKVGDTFESSHGISVGSHDHEHDYQVVGILTPSGNVIDRLVLTSIETVWYTHEEESELEAEKDHSELHQEISKTGFPEGDEEKEITSLLIQYRSPMAAVQLPRMINSGTSMQAASPTFEMARLFELLGIGVSLLQGLAFVLIGISGLGIFIALYNSLKERKYDLAILRAIGASRRQLVFLIFLEGIMLTSIGALVGILLGHSFLAVIISQNEQGVAASLDAWIFLKGELWILVYALMVGILASLIPAWSAYQTSIAKQLAKS